MAKILLVDDDPSFVEAIKIILESSELYKVTCAYDGEEGLAKIKEEQPDLIILDVMMPKKDGYTLCEELKDSSEYSRIPIILLTAVAEEMHNTTYSAEMGANTQADDYIAKPIKPAELLSRVSSLLENIA